MFFLAAIEVRGGTECRPAICLCQFRLVHAASYLHGIFSQNIEVGVTHMLFHLSDIFSLQLECSETSDSYYYTRGIWTRQWTSATIAPTIAPTIVLIYSWLCVYHCFSLPVTSSEKSALRGYAEGNLTPSRVLCTSRAF